MMVVDGGVFVAVSMPRRKAIKQLKTYHNSSALHLAFCIF